MQINMTDNNRMLTKTTYEIHATLSESTFLLDFLFSAIQSYGIQSPKLLRFTSTSMQ